MNYTWWHWTVWGQYVDGNEHHFDFMGVSYFGAGYRIKEA